MQKKKKANLQECGRRWSERLESLVEAEEEEREGVILEDHAAEVGEEPIAGDGVEHGSAGLQPPSSMSAVVGMFADEPHHATTATAWGCRGQLQLQSIFFFF